MNEYWKFRSKRLKELDETFEITHFYGDDYPENINVEVNKIINNEWKLNNLQSKIDKAIEYLDEVGNQFDNETAYRINEYPQWKKLSNILKEDK